MSGGYICANKETTGVGEGQKKTEGVESERQYD